MVNYQNGKIYKIISNLTDKIYIGSTTKNTLAERLTKHRNQYKCYFNGKGNYLTSFELIKLDHYQIIFLERYPCNSKDELNAREQYHIDQNKDMCVNMKKAFTGIKAETKQEYDKEYRKKNKEKLQECDRQYYNENKQEINKKVLCECGALFTKQYLSRHQNTLKHINFLNHEWDNLHPLI